MSENTDTAVSETVRPEGFKNRHRDMPGVVRGGILFNAKTAAMIGDSIDLWMLIPTDLVDSDPEELRDRLEMFQCGDGPLPYVLACKFECAIAAAAGYCMGSYRVNEVYMVRIQEKYLTWQQNPAETVLDFYRFAFDEDCNNYSFEPAGWRLGRNDRERDQLWWEPARTDNRQMRWWTPLAWDQRQIRLAEDEDGVVSELDDTVITEVLDF